MDDTDLQAAIDDYLRAFAAISRAEQERLLRTSVAEDVVFANPGVSGNGHRDLLAHIDAFQARFPGSTFRVNWIVQQHGQVLSEWTQLNEDGSECVTAHSYVMGDSEGRIKRWAGFWQDGAVKPVYADAEEREQSR